MNTEIRIQNIHEQTTLSRHRRRCIAAYIYDRTRHGQRTTCRQVAAALSLAPNQINTLLRLCQTEPTQTTAGMVIVVPMGKRTDSGGVTAQTYAAIIHNKNPNQ